VIGIVVIKEKEKKKMKHIISDIKEFLSSGWIIFIPITIICCITVCIALLATTNGVKWWPYW
jgi:hypothetical protein